MFRNFVQQHSHLCWALRYSVIKPEQDLLEGREAAEENGSETERLQLCDSKDYIKSVYPSVFPRSASGFAINPDHVAPEGDFQSLLK